MATLFSSNYSVKTSLYVYEDITVKIKTQKETAAFEDIQLLKLKLYEISLFIF